MNTRPLALWPLWLALSTPAFGATPDVTTLVSDAETAHEKGEFLLCSELYAKAYALRGDVALLLNEGVCLFDAGEDTRAAETLRRLLRLDAPNEARDTANAILADIEARQGDTAASVRPGETSQAFHEPAPGPTKAAAVEGPRDDRGSTFGTRETLALTLGGVTVAWLAVGTVFGLSAQSDWQAAERACPNKQRCPDDSGARLSDSAADSARLSTGAFAMGGLSAAGAIAVLLVWPAAKAQPVTVTATGRVPLFLAVEGKF